MPLLMLSHPSHTRSHGLTFAFSPGAAGRAADPREGLQFSAVAASRGAASRDGVSDAAPLTAAKSWARCLECDGKELGCRDSREIMRHSDDGDSSLHDGCHQKNFWNIMTVLYTKLFITVCL